MTERLIDPETNTPADLDLSIRPKRLQDYIGQPSICEQMKIFIDAAKKRQEPLDHTLLFGPPGLGKTTLANIIAHEMGVSLKQTSGPVLEKAGDLASILTNLEQNDVLFIDEIHRLSPAIEEILYPAMEDFQIDIMIGEGPSARSIKLDLPTFTLVGATTRAGSLTSPLRDRFGITQRLEFYQQGDIEKIVKRSASILEVACDPKGASQIAQRSRGTPRIANRLLRRVRDFASIKADGQINFEIAKNALDCLNVDTAGLDYMDRHYLKALIENFQGGPTGIESLAATLGEDRHTLSDVVEPYLLQQGLLQRSARGRHATAKAYQHFSLPCPQQHNNDLLTNLDDDSDG